MTSLADLRKNYSLGSLDAADVDADPIRQFQAWFAQALDAQLPEPNAMTVATVDAEGRPAARILLIKGVDERGFVFFTNYDSRKGHELTANPNAALLFHWVELERQVRIEGRVEKTSAAESDAYYQSRPLGSRIGAWASEQSAVIQDRAQLEAREREISAQYGDAPPRPPHWGGYRLVPTAIEFWQGRPSRLHDRIRYTRDSAQADAAWRIERLAP
ncbi:MULTISPECIES: pyridoxamine 5'-phosphate oxidase [unclassified Paraburkholderia]|uniref:pyridoxamine 5'-phosphate oxidase n=1 Tax=unclassified Paraburkholderia TaxID=2615204 RepID=UPI00197E2BA5|nr:MULTISPECIES: pyridoxamine 5'-phosphate oxidase [unclassified Paraburkholderia]MBN3852635.1 pyridoxamine 5'-phosphate oxidase [Paraburkholderia sp. Ac-20340]